MGSIPTSPTNSFLGSNVMDNNEQLVWICAIRYGLSRQSYICGFLAEMLKTNIDKFSKENLEIILEDIYFQEKVMSNLDRKLEPEWKDLKSFLLKKLK